MKVSLIGTGLMGRPLAERILKAGFSLTVYNRTPAKLRPLLELGARRAESPSQAIAAADVVILMLSDGRAIRTTILSSPARRQLRGKTVVQMGTISPFESTQIQKDSPVSLRDG